MFGSVVKCAKLVKVNYFEMNMSSVDCLVEGMINDCSLSDMLTSNITVPPLLVLILCQKGNVLTTQQTLACQYCQEPKGGKVCHSLCQ